MSGPVSTVDVATTQAQERPVVCEMDVLEGRAAEVGGFAVQRVLPRRQRRTVGAWCFVDLMGPGEVVDGRGLDIGPHPHIGLQTVTWLLRGAVLHRDSLGSEQLIRAGELNLMTAGHGVSHSEETTGSSRGALHGIQLWVAQPSTTRDGEAAFEHHDHVPQVELSGGVASVLIGEALGVSSPARRDTDHVGVDLDLAAGRTVVPLDTEFEHALVPVDGGVTVGERRLDPGSLGYLGLGRDEVPIHTDDRTRVLLIGGVPFPEPLLMWWNYVARTRDEITAAHRDWMSATVRYGRVASPLARLVTSGPPWSEPVR